MSRRARAASTAAMTATGRAGRSVNPQRHAASTAKLNPATALRLIPRSVVVRSSTAWPPDRGLSACARTSARRAQTGVRAAEKKHRLAPQQADTIRVRRETRMRTGGLRGVLEHLRLADGGLTDGQLLTRFLD